MTLPPAVDTILKDGILDTLGLLNKEGSLNVSRAIEIKDGRVQLRRVAACEGWCDAPNFDWVEYFELEGRQEDDWMTEEGSENEIEMKRD